MSVKSQQITKEATAERVQAAPAVTNRVRGFAGNHTMMRKQSARGTLERLPDESRQRQTLHITDRWIELGATHEMLPSSVDGSTNSIKRKCVACGSTSEACPECSEDAADMHRKVRAPQGRTEEAGEKKGELAKPTQTVELGYPVCGKEYGAKAKLSYEGTGGWWLKETIAISQDTCSKSGKAIIDPTKGSIQNPADIDYFIDQITNSDGPPAKPAPCKTVTTQTIFIGPTKATVEKYKYLNTQTIEVTLDNDKSPRSGQVITTVDTESQSAKPASCNWKEDPDKPSTKASTGLDPTSNPALGATERAKARAESFEGRQKRGAPLR